MRRYRRRSVDTRMIPVTDGVRLAVDIWEASGDGVRAVSRPGPVPFVLVHGLSSNARMWDGVAEHLQAAGHPVAAVDQRGHGRSDKPDGASDMPGGAYDLATVADDLALVVSELGWSRPVAAGQSWGGNVVVELAWRHPAAVRGIACVDGGWLDLAEQIGSWEECALRLAPPRTEGMAFTDIERFIRGSHPDWPEAGIQGALANFERRPDGTVAPWLSFDRHMLVLKGMYEHKPFDLFPTLSVPVLLVPCDDGGSWAAAKRPSVEKAEATIPHVRTHWFRADHDVHAQHPTELAELLLECVGDGFFA